MTTETLADKAGRLLTAGSVHVLRAAPERVVARVFGDSGNWDVHLIDGRWSCSCPAAEVRRHCSHLAAVQLVTVPPWARRRSA